MMGNRVIVLFIASLVAANLVAHHAVNSDDIDYSTRISLEGKIANIEWINPHVIIHIEVLSEFGVKQLWLVEAATPNTLLRSGLNRNSLSLMSSVSFEAYPSIINPCTVTCLSYGISITTASGRTSPLGDL